MKYEKILHVYNDKTEFENQDLRILRKLDLRLKYRGETETSYTTIIQFSVNESGDIIHKNWVNICRPSSRQCRSDNVLGVIHKLCGQ